LFLRLLQVYRDIPLPSWQVVFPDKLLQFRPLDLLRLDLFGLAGAGAVLAQAKYSSLILELVTLVSLSVWGTRMVLGYMRMGDRWDVPPLNFDHNLRQLAKQEFEDTFCCQWWLPV
jgi:hypothetical protein